MPIRPEMKARYPADWPDIRARIRDRSGNRCEWCGVRNGAVGLRFPCGEFREVNGVTVAELAEHYDCDPSRARAIRIVLTVAHVHNPDPADCRDENLAHLCQRCHNTHDAGHRASTRRQTIDRRRGQLQLFQEISNGPNKAPAGGAARAASVLEEGVPRVARGRSGSRERAGDPGDARGVPSPAGEGEGGA